MLLWENIILAVNSLLSNKMRAILTMLGIIIGIGSVIAIITVGDSLTLSVSENMQSMGANDVYVMVSTREKDEEISSIDGISFGTDISVESASESDYISREMIKELCSKFPNEIYAINAQTNIGNVKVGQSRETINASVTGVSAGYFITNELTMLAGHMFTEKDFNDGKKVILVSDEFVKEVFDSNIQEALGKEVELNINNESNKFTIVGIYEQEPTYLMQRMMSNNGSSGHNIYIPLKTANNLQHEEINYSYIQVITNVGIDCEKLAGEIENFFEPYYRTNRDFEVTTMTISSIASMLTEMLSTITLAISIVAAIALVVGGIGVMNIMLVSITERTKEIGTRKALGAPNSSIRIQFIVEAMIICLIGGVIGMILGIVGGIIASNILGYPASPSIWGIIISLVFSMAIGIFFGYYPANKAAKMNPIDALRYE